MRAAEKLSEPLQFHNHAVLQDWTSREGAAGCLQFAGATYTDSVRWNQGRRCLQSILGRQDRIRYSRIGRCLFLQVVGPVRDPYSKNADDSIKEGHDEDSGGRDSDFFPGVLR